MNRRQFFGRSLAGSGALAFPHLARSSQSGEIAPGQKPQSIIHMVADGMSMGTYTCADYLSQRLRNRGLSWRNLVQTPGSHTCLMNMRSIDSMVTDSAAASSSWGSGSRVPNGALNILPSGRELVPLFTLLAQKGWKRGLVTTTEITHATPAGFVVSTSSREDSPEIAQQFLRGRVDVLLGGGARRLSAKDSASGAEFHALFAQAGYHVMQTAQALQAAPTERPWLGTFAPGHLPFTIDWEHDSKLRQEVPALAAMTARALEWMGRHEHFILQIEGGRVDHAAHNCDAAAALRDLIAFDEAIEVVLQFQKKRPDTLLVVTTDHGNGNMGLNGSGQQYRDSSGMLGRVAQAKASFPVMLQRIRDQGKGSAAPSLRVIQEVLSDLSGLAISERHATAFRNFLAGEITPIYGGLHSEVGQLGQLLANYNGIGWAGTAHTADFVPLTAVGPGADQFRGFLHNVDLFRKYLDFAGIDYQNPQEPIIAEVLSQADPENAVEYARA